MLTFKFDIDDIIPSFKNDSDVRLVPLILSSVRYIFSSSIILSKSI